MTLRRKTILIIGATLIGLLLILFAVSQGILLSSFSRLEVKDTSKNVERALGALSDETSSLVTMTRDWAVWDDTYNFIENGNNEYIEANPTDAEFEALRVNVMLFINSSGQIVYSEAFDLEQEQEVPVPQSLLGHISPESIILQHSNTESGVSGIILLPEGPLLIAAQPILTSQGDGPIRGTLIWGRYLDSAEIGRLAETTHLSLTVQRLDEPQMSSDFEAARSSLSEKTPIFVRPLDKEFVAGYSLLEDVYGKPVMMLRIDLPREIYHQGQTSQLYFLASILGVGLVFGVVVLLLLGESVLAPLSRLSAAVSSIGRTGVLSTRVSAKGKDELSSLAGEINRMLGSLELSCEKLRESEEKFKRLVEDMNDGYFVVQNYRIVFANARSAEMFGYSVENTIGKTVEQFLPPTVVESLSEWHTRRLRGEIVPRQYELTLIRNDGTSVMIEFGARRMYYEGKPAVSVVVRDVTERKHAEEHYSALVGSITEVVFKFKGKKITWCNDRVKEIYGYTKEELIGREASFLFPEDISPAEFIKKVSSSIEEKGVFRETAMVRRKDGRTVDVEFSISLIPGSKPVELVSVARDVTERKRIEEEVSKSEARYRSLIETASAGVAIIDLKGEVVLVNEALCNMVGYSREELIGMNFVDFLHSDDAPRLLELFVEGLTGQDKNPILEFRIIHGDGRILWLHSSPTALVQGNETIGFSAIIHDITERVQMEKALRQSEERFRNVLDNSLDMIYSMNLQTGKYEYVSPASKKVLGYSPEDFISIATEKLVSLVHPDDAGNLEQNIIDLITEGKTRTLSIEYRVNHKELGYRWVSDNRSLVYDEGHMPVAVVGSLRDITERKLVEETLRLSEERFRYVLDNSLDMIYSLNLYTGKYEYVSPASRKMLGYSPEEFIGGGLGVARATIHPDDIQRLDENFTELINSKGNTTPRIQYRVKHKELGYRWVSDSRSVVYDNGHTPVAVVGSMRDITERKEAEEKLNQIMAELARSNTELEQFAYVASHDLQEPLRMVAAYTQLLARRYKGKLDADADEFIGYAVDGATRMQQLINGLLDYSRVGTRGKPFGSTDCEAVFNNAVANLRAAIKETDAVVIHDHLPTVLADSTQMVQLFQNLLGNSIKFHSDKPPEIHVRAQRNGSEWIFSVRDNGIGIDPKYFERIFIIFQRLHSRGEYPGTGIGLAICKKIVERHKGRIWVESELGKGATFYFTIPMGGEGK
jgi:PAS domain S-box-containing protein